MLLFLRALIVIVVLSLSASSWGAETTKFRYTLSIYTDDKGVTIQHPEGVACSEKHGIVVGDTENDRLLKYSFQEKSIKGGTEIKFPQLLKPIGVQINSKGEIFALDGKQRRIVRIGADSAFKENVAVGGAPGSATVVPRSFRIDRDDNMYVLDIFSGRVVVLGADGKFQRQIEFPKEYGFFSDIAVDAKGTVLLLDSIKARIYSAAKGAGAFAPLGGSLKEYLSFPTNMTADSRGTIYVVDQNGGAIGIVAQDGSFLGKQLAMGWNEGLLYYPAQICINEMQGLLIADRGNSRIQMFSIVK